MIRGLIGIGAAILLALAVACGGNSEPSGARTTPADIPDAILDAVDNYILSGAIGSIIPGKGLDPDDCSDSGDVCLQLGPPTSVSEDEATVVIFINQSDAAWKIHLSKEDGDWRVSDVTYTGCC